MSRLGNILKEMITNKEGTLGTSGYINGNWRIRKVGKVAFFTIVNLTNIPAGTFSLGRIIPEGYRPADNVAFTLQQRGTSLRVIAIAIAPSGEVSCYNYGSASSSTVLLNTNLSWAIA